MKTKNNKSRERWLKYKKLRNKSKVCVQMPNGITKSFTHYQSGTK